MASDRASPARTAPLVRKQFLLTREQSARLKGHAASTGQTETDIVRAGIDLALQAAQRKETAWKEVWAEAAGLWADRDDLDQFYAERRRRRAERRAKFDAGG
jgi:hypothetical protein